MTPEAYALHLVYRIGLHCHDTYTKQDLQNHDLPWMQLSWYNDRFSEYLFDAFRQGILDGQALHEFHDNLKELLAP